MAIQIVCPKCQTTYTIGEEQAGKKVRCKKCDTVFTAELPDVKAAEERVTPRRSGPRPVEGAEEDRTERRRPQPRAAAGRRRDRYEEDEDDFGPRRARPGRRKASHLGLFLIIGGVVGSLFVVVGCIVLAFWLLTREPARNDPEQQQAAAQQLVRAMFQPPGAENNGQDANHDDNKPEAAEANVKEPDPPPPEPKEPEFASPAPVEAAAAPQGPARAELDPEVVRKVKAATVFLAVTLPDGNIANGSGFFGLEPRIILTNAHVVGMLRPSSSRPKSIEAVRNKGTQDEKKLTAELIGVDRSCDLAILRTNGSDAPPPLEVKSAGNLRETQRVWVAGFPLGERPGREISLSDSSVSSLRRDEHGLLTRVQVNGGMEPGNSGGPVVDAYGNVVGVSVSIFRGTKLNFAVPGDSVRSLVSGRIAGLTLGQPYLRDGNIRVKATMRLLDPLGRIRNPGLDIWTGDPKTTPRPSATAEPEKQPGDSLHNRQELVLHGQEAKAEIALPPLTPGKVYWVQPHWLDPNRKPQWASAHVYNIPAPVESRPAQLLLKHRTGSRDAILHSWNSVKVSDQERGEYGYGINVEARLAETTEAIDKEERANIRLNCRSYNMAIKVENQAVPVDKNLRQVRQDITKVIGSIQLDKNGNPVAHQVDMKNVQPGPAYQNINAAFGSLQRAVDGLTVPIPNKEVSPGESWNAQRLLPLYYQQYQMESSPLDMTYTYLGTRQQSGRNEAVIALAGQVAKSKSPTIDVSGRADGTAVIDLANGQVLHAEIVIYFEVDLTRMGHGIKTIGTSHIRVRHTPAADARS
jgi:predicted Zn finger-like uncharacterized protein